MKKIILKIIYNILAFFTRIYLRRINPFVIGITGSVGKTSCRMVVYQILKKYEKEKVIYTSPKNFNSELGLIFSIFKIEKYNPGIKSLIKIVFKIIILSLFSSKKYDILLLEYGVDHLGDMDFLLSIVKPDISIFTKLDSIHIENFDSINGILNEKIKLINNSKKVSFLNYKDEYLKKIYNKLNINRKYYGKEKLVYNYLLDNGKIFSELKFGNKKIKTNILGEENFIYIELGFLILDFLNIKYPLNDFIKLKNQGGRFSIFKGINNSILIDSTYNAGPESMIKMIENTIKIRDSLFLDYKLIFVIGDMRELGIKSEEKHKELYSIIKSKGLIISVGKETNKYFGENVKKYLSSKDAGIYLKDFLINSNKKYIILFKGSQNTIFCEEALKQVLLDKKDVKKLVRQESYWKK